MSDKDKTLVLLRVPSDVYEYIMARVDEINDKYGIKPSVTSVVMGLVYRGIGIEKQESATNNQQQ